MGNNQVSEYKEMVQKDLDAMNLTKLPQSYIHPQIGDKNPKNQILKFLSSKESVIKKVKGQSPKKIEELVETIKKKIQNYHFLDLNGIFTSLNRLKDIAPGLIGITCSILLMIVDAYKQSVETQYKAEISYELMDFLIADISSELTLAKEDCQAERLQSAYDRCRTGLQRVLTRLESGKIKDWVQKIVKGDQQIFKFGKNRTALKLIIMLYTICKYLGKTIALLPPFRTNQERDKNKIQKVLKGLENQIIDIRINFIVDFGGRNCDQVAKSDMGSGFTRDCFNQEIYQINYLIHAFNKGKSQAYKALHAKIRQKLQQLIVQQLRSDEI